MFKHYLTTALRNYARHKITTTINVLGLALGLTTFAIAYGIAMYNSHGDLYHEKAARTYVLMQKNEITASDWSVGFQPVSGPAIGPLLKSNFSSLEYVARITMTQELAAAAGEKRTFVNASFADPAFLDVFDFDFVAGDRRAALQAPHSAVIRDELALQLWGRLDVVGETLLLNNKVRVNIGGVMRAPREPSHLVASTIGGGLGFSMLVSMDTRNVFLDDYQRSHPELDFTNVSAYTYVVVPKSSQKYVDVVRSGLANFGNKYLAPQFGKATFALRPASEIRQASIEVAIGTQKNGLSPTTAILFAGALVLLVACLNYANLTAAHATTRTKELAMLRVVGATRGQIAVQAFIEALILVGIASLLALALLPFVGAALKLGIGMDIRPVLYQSHTFALAWIATVLATATVAAIYPAAVIVRVRPAQALQTARRSHTKRLALRLLVVAQLVAASYLLITSTVMRTQNNVLWELAAKLQTDPVVIIANDLPTLRVDPQLVKTELRKQSAIKSVSGILTQPGGRPQGVSDLKLVMTNAEASSHHWLAFRPVIDSEFFTTMDIPLLAGRNFSDSITADHGSDEWYGNMIIDRALAAQYGWNNPQDAIGKQIYLPAGGSSDAPGKAVNVIGVVENRTIYPLSLFGSNSTAYSFDEEWSKTILVRIPKLHLEEGLQAIDKVWHELVPNVPLKRRFVDEQFEIAYRQVNALSTGSSFIGALTMLVAAMGLLGIATHTIAQRTYEIGVRRTLGASARQVLAMLLKDFAKPAIIANLIAWPLAYGAALFYRTQFTQHVPISFAPFVGSLTIGVGIAWLAVLRQATLAARMNPASVLRHE